jgi:nitrite reductase (NADH) small subunit
MKKEISENRVLPEKIKEWFKACRTGDVPDNGGSCIKYQDEQIAIFHFADLKEWFATQNLCPHKQQMSLSHGLLGDSAGEPKVACPFHKKTFSLKSGSCLTDPELYCIKTYPVKVEDGFVLIGIRE